MCFERIKKAAALILCLAMAGTFAGCSKDTKVILTTDMKKDEVFRIEDVSCTLPEVMVYLTNMQNQYEAVYGEQIWEKTGSKGSLEQAAKQQVLAELAQVKAMTLLAKEKGTQLGEREEERVTAAAKEYFGSLNEEEIAALGVNEELIAQMYREYALAEKIYQQIVEDVNPEISDDEARTITVQWILMEDAIKAAEVCEKAKEEDANFESLAEGNSKDPVISHSFGKGEVETAIEEAAFDLGKDEVSDVVEATDGYYILKCTSTFDEAQTQLNKEKIADKRRNEAFDKEYNTFVASLVRRLNEELWDSVTFLHQDSVKTDSFFSVYNTYFQIE